MPLPDIDVKLSLESLLHMSESSSRALVAQADIKRLSWRIYWNYQLHLMTAVVPLIYLSGLVMGFTSEQEAFANKNLQPVSFLATGLLGPFAIIYFVIKNTLTPIPGETESDRLVRILKAPRRIELGLEALVFIGTGLYITVCHLVLKTSVWSIPWGAVVTLSANALVMIQVRLSSEQMLRPHALALFHANPTQVLNGSGLFWIRQSWFLPYTFGLFVFASLMMTGTILSTQVRAVFTQLTQQYGEMNQADFGALLAQGSSLVMDRALLPILGIGAYLLINAALSALRLARHQTEGASAVQASIEALAAGTAKLPDWVTTDEVGDLSRATAMVFDRLGNLSLSLAESARMLGKSAEEMGDSNVKQTEILTRQAAAIQETQVTTQEIKQTSLVASQKAESVLLQTERAHEISRSGEAAVEQSLGGLQAIRDHVKEMESRIKALDERAKQIGKITTTVKDLADQSNMLALNAAIEAVRSGEHGKGFGVVAKEIRSLADQSIRATHNIRSILQGIGTAIASAATLTEKGTKRVESSLVQIQSFSQQVQQLSAIVRDNANSVRQIAAAVTQQDAGIVQITQAVTDMTRIMDQTMTQLRASEEAIGVVREVAEQVTGFVGQYGWIQDETAASPEKQPSNG